MDAVHLEMGMRTGCREFPDGDGGYRLFWYVQDDRFIHWKTNLEVRYWCMQQWGQIPTEGYWSWNYQGDGRFTFDDEGKLTLFKLRWA
jgi:hypothetical protein